MTNKIFRALSFLIVAAGLVLAGAPGTALADHCKGKHKNDAGCDAGGNDGGGSGEISVRVTLDDDPGDTLLSDGGAYIDGVDKVTANISDWFRMTPENRSPRTITIDFGPTVDCNNAAVGPGDCIVDVNSGQPIECPHGAGLAQCSGARTVYLFLRDVILDDTTTTTIHVMAPDGIQHLVQHWDPEIQIIAEKRQTNGWVLIFKDDAGLNACDGVSEQLGITATDTGTDGIADVWSITTDTTGIGGLTTKIACIAKQGRNSREFVGFVEMQFGFTIERLN